MENMTRLAATFLPIVIVATVALSVAIAPITPAGPALAYAQTGSSSGTNAGVPSSDNPPSVDCSFWGVTLGGNAFTCGGAALIYGLTFTLVGITARILEMVGSLFDTIFQLTILDFGSFLGVNAPNSGTGGFMDTINSAWGIVRDIANIIIIGILVFAAIRTILGIREYGAKGLVARVILIAILINFSLLFTKMAIDGSNLVATSFYQTLQVDKNLSAAAGSTDTSTSANQSSPSIAGAFENMLGITTITQTAKTSSEMAKGQSFTAAFIYAIFVPIILICTAIILLYGVYLLLARAVVFIVLMLSASFAFASYLLPGKGKAMFWDPWLQALISNVVFAPLLVVSLWVVVVVGRGLMQTPALKGNFSAFSSINPQTTLTNADIIAGFISYFIILAMIYLAFSLSSRFAQQAQGLSMANSLWRRTAVAGSARLGGLAWQQTYQRARYGLAQNAQGRAETHRNLALQATTRAALAHAAGNVDEAERHQAEARRQQELASIQQRRSNWHQAASQSGSFAGVEGYGAKAERKGREAEKIARKNTPSEGQVAEEATKQSGQQFTQSQAAVDRARQEHERAEEEHRSAVRAEEEAQRQKQQLQQEYEKQIADATNRGDTDTASRMRTERDSALKEQDMRIKNARDALSDTQGRLAAAAGRRTIADASLQSAQAVRQRLPAGVETAATAANSSAIQSAARVVSSRGMDRYLVNEDHVADEALRLREQSTRSKTRLLRALRDSSSGTTAQADTSKREPVQPPIVSPIPSPAPQPTPTSGYGAQRVTFQAPQQTVSQTDYKTQQVVELAPQQQPPVRIKYNPGTLVPPVNQQAANDSSESIPAPHISITPSPVPAISESEVEPLLTSLPKVPLAPGSRFSGIDRNVLPSQTLQSLSIGDDVAVRTPQGFRIARVQTKHNAGITAVAANGDVLNVMPALNETYRLSDLQKLRSNPKP